MEQRLGRVSTTRETGEPLDRIFVHDYVLEVEIGVHHNEKGVTQRVRFSVDIDLTPSRQELEDDIEHTLDYDYVINGIKAIIARGHINLVETLAEDVAQHCLAHPRAARVTVGIEKLDKDPGAVGVEVMRSKREA
ncbi:MAG TPA: dihydroneopterin aldolase [Hyphomicrobiales bacterium]|jgi:dihydroneopterin aldolase|nr:dihydroneopterin aldolase [Hyphomicrobiales bacterium]